jgi:hypothetical protein
MRLVDTSGVEVLDAENPLGACVGPAGFTCSSGTRPSLGEIFGCRCGFHESINCTAFW